MNNYTRFLTDLVNMDVEIKEEDKVVILLNSLLNEEYDTVVPTSINSKQTLNYSDVSAALVNYEVKRKNNQSSSKSDSAEVLTIRGRSSSKKSKSDRERLKSRLGFRDLKKNNMPCAKSYGTTRLIVKGSKIRIRS